MKHHGDRFRVDFQCFEHTVELNFRSTEAVYAMSVARPDLKPPL